MQEQLRVYEHFGLDLKDYEYHVMNAPPAFSFIMDKNLGAEKAQLT